MGIMLDLVEKLDSIYQLDSNSDYWCVFEFSRSSTNPLLSWDKFQYAKYLVHNIWFLLVEQVGYQVGSMLVDCFM